MGQGLTDNINYIKRMTDCYEAGYITHNDFGCLFLRTVTDEDAADVFAALPQELKLVVVEKALEYGHTVTAYTAGYNYRCGGSDDMEAYERNRSLHRENYARGVKAVKNLIDDYCNKIWGKE